MMKFVLSIVICFAFASVGIFCEPEKCKQGPTYWCQNEQTALECGAVLICEFQKKSSSSQKYIKFEPVDSTANAPPVNVTLFYESLCPDCKQIWSYQLYPTFQKLQNSGVLNVELVPYGNAQERAYGSQWIYYCQHGTPECTGNFIETCAIKLYPDQNQYMPFVHCLEYYGPTLKNAQYCASLQKMDYARIESCSQGSDGNQYEHEMALKTYALNPPHQYVPWFTMNGYHDNTVQQQLSTNMLNYVCTAYTGTKPQACK